MIKRLKRKFILLSMLPLLMLLIIVVAGMNIANYLSFVRETDSVLEMLSHNKGTFPDIDPDKDPLPGGITPETPHESRYFTVLVSPTGLILQTDTKNIATVDSRSAGEYALRVLAEDSTDGFADSFRYVKTREGGAIRIAFLDCRMKLDFVRTFLLSSVIASLVGYLLVFAVIVIVADKIVQPFAENYEKQRRFITDASHEIKTPLTIISANSDLLEMEYGESEYTAEIRTQISHLRDLTNGLVYLAKTEEPAKQQIMVDVPISELAEEICASFAAPAMVDGKEIVRYITPALFLRGEDKAIASLISILLENAVKYSPENEKITVTLEKQLKAVVLTVKNLTDLEISRESLTHIFDRFYRPDTSHNSATGGHGIGLSIAKAITENHGGKISAKTDDGHTLAITVTLPTSAKSK